MTTITENTILGQQVSTYLVQDLNNLKTTSQKLGIDFTTDTEAVNIVKDGVTKIFKKQLMKPQGEMYKAAIAFITGN